MTRLKVLEWVSVYWFSRSGPTAAGRIYYEMTGGGTRDYFEGTKWTSTPLGVSYFPGEIVRLPKSYVLHDASQIFLCADRVLMTVC